MNGDEMWSGHLQYMIECPDCGNRVSGTLAGGTPIGPAAVGHAWPKHYRLTVALGCTHYGADHLVEAQHLHQETNR